MAVFSVNQNRHLYVLNAYGDVTSASDAGTMSLKAIGEGTEKELFFTYKGADTTLRTDRIPLKNLNYVKKVSAAEMLIPLKVVEVTLNDEVNEGKIVPGQDYVLRINFRQFYGLGDKNEYVKDAAVHGSTSLSTAEDFFDAMKASLDAAFSRELGATKTENPYLTFTVSGSGNSAKLVITEKPQDWTLGIGQQERVYFDVNPTQIYLDGDEPIWGVVADATPAKMVVDEESQDDPQPLIPNEDLVAGTNAIGNGHQIADLEWFCAGERGDIYRMAGYPNYIPTKYLVDPTQEYNVIEFHFAFTDEGVNSYRSEKDITIVSTDTAELDKLIDDLNTAADANLLTEFGD